MHKLIALHAPIHQRSQLDIVYRGLNRSDAVEADVVAHAEQLASVTPDFLSCRVLIQALSKHHCHGQPFHVRLELTRASGSIVVGREPGRDAGHSDVYVALHDAFRCARRRLDRLRSRCRSHGRA